MTDTQVRITPDGAALIDAEPIDVPPGVDPARVVLQQLALDAAGSGGPIAAAIHDTRTEQRLRLQINPDGSTRALAPGEPILPHTPARAPAVESSTSPEHEQALQAVYEAGRAHDFARAAAQADRLLADLTVTHGERHPATLTTAGVRADLAWMSGDYRYAAELWTYIAQGWAQSAGPASRAARSSARQAAASWKDVPDTEALASGQPLLAMLATVAPTPETNPTVLAVRRRISLLTPA
ncbi:hypothetical protein ABT263_35850 [Kitasatospora sp. NPDC001603]|uniref:hypothetical protein n=1 Tax=Kitasatospora sp. NPDC001603 TaxID=3154388 RepID=UPI0033197B71